MELQDCEEFSFNKRENKAGIFAKGMALFAFILHVDQDLPHKERNHYLDQALGQSQD